MNHFFVKPEDIRNEKIYISGSDVNHIKNVLRMKAGEELLLSDGEGKDYHCRIEAFSEDLEDLIVCEILDTTTSRTELPARFYLFQGLPKADKFEHIIQKSVELGVYEIIPVETARCVVKYDEKKQKNKGERWQKIAESAAKQSKRGIVPEVKPVMKFQDALAYAKELDMVLIPYENFKDMKTTKETIARIEAGMQIGIFIGPEGGFEQEEVEQAQTLSGAEAISLGNRILRTETAPLMLLSVLSFQLER